MPIKLSIYIYLLQDSNVLAVTLFYTSMEYYFIQHYVCQHQDSFLARPALNRLLQFNLTNKDEKNRYEIALICSNVKMTSGHIYCVKTLTALV